MKYMFVVQGEGRGHLTQALSLKTLLEKNGHEVVSVMVGCSAKRSIPDFFSKKKWLWIVALSQPELFTGPKG